jgi:hypothetical protein
VSDSSKIRYGTAFEIYHQQGWSVIPLKRQTKWPPPTGWTGEDGAMPSYADMREWADNGYRDGNLAIRLPRNVIGIDVDHYGRKRGGDTLTEAETRWGALPATYRSTSRTDGKSCIRLYRIPESVKLRQGIEFTFDDGKPTLGSIEIIQHHHRYVVCWPSAHDKSGLTYRWYDPDGKPVDQPPALAEIPELPAKWVEALTEPERNGAEIDPDFTADTSDVITEGDMSERVALKLGRAQAALYGSSRRHDKTRDKVLGLLRCGKNGEPGVREALRILMDTFVARVGKDRPGGHDEAKQEFLRFIFGSDKDADAKRFSAGQLARLSDTSYDDDSDDNEPPESSDSLVTATDSGSDDAREARIASRVEQFELDTEARRRFKATLAQQLCKQAEPPIPLADFLAVPDTEAQYRIDDLLPIGARALLTAQYKAGKTTMRDNLVKALADNRMFLNHFHVVQARVALIDTEMDQRQMRRWLRAHSIQVQANVSVVPLRGAVSTFNILDPDVMAMWVEWLSDFDVIILDCLRPVLDAIGLSEDHEAGRFLVAFDELLKRCGASEAVVIHHMGHNGERSRGDSRLEDWPDVTWRIIKDNPDNPDDPTADRYFSAFGRDVDVHEGKLDHTAETRELSYLGQSRKANKALHLVPKIVELVRGQPGMTKSDIEKAELTDAPRQQRRDALATAITNSYIYAQKSEDKSHAIRHYINPSHEA